MFLFIMLDAGPCAIYLRTVLTMLSIMLAWDITRWRRTLPFIMLCSMPGHTQYTLGPVTCIDSDVDNAFVGYHQMASYF